MNIDEITKDSLKALSKQEREALVKDKMAKTKYSDSLSHAVTKPVKEAEGKAEEPNNSTAKENSVDVTIVCNTTWLCDSHMDVLATGCYDESIAEKGISIPHIADHQRSSTAHVGDVTKIYTKDFDASVLGLPEGGKTQALVMESTVRKDYNSEVYKFYKNGKINQHSIGLNYVEIKLALDSDHKEDAREKAIWDEAYPNILNKELVDRRGYFWLVNKININENSCVLFGANSLTPTLAVKSDLLSTTITQPTKVGITMTLQEALAANVELTAQVATLKAESTGILAKGASAEKTRITAILDSAKTLGIKPELALKQIQGDVPKEVALTIFETVKEALDDATALNIEGDTPTINPKTTPDDEDKGLSMVDFEKAIDTLDNDEKKINWGGR